MNTYRNSKVPSISHTARFKSVDIERMTPGPGKYTLLEGSIDKIE
jgi:hypothetical protein